MKWCPGGGWAPAPGGNKENSRTNEDREEEQANKQAGEGTQPASRAGGVGLISGFVFGIAAKQVGETEGAQDELFLRFCCEF